MLERAAHDVEPMAAFSLMRGRSLHLPFYIESGIFPWWTSEDFRLAFFRYVTVATVWLDYKLWPDSPALMHLHSLVWAALLVGVVTSLYRRFMGPAAPAGLASAFFLLDEAHSTPTAWLANRNALLATLFGVVAIIAHDRWRRSKRSSWRWVGWLSFSLGLASGEMALGALGYLGAYATLLDTKGWKKGLRALTGYGVAALLWAATYVSGGYGTRGSGLYLNPVLDFQEYLKALPERASFLLLGQWTALPADLGWLLPPVPTTLVWILGLMLLTLLAVVVVPLARGDRVAAFWAVGMLISLLPVAATFPSNRLLLLAGVGGMGLAGTLAAQAYSSHRIVGRLGRALAGFLVVQHLILAPLLAQAGFWLVGKMSDPTHLALSSLSSDVSAGETTLVVANTPDYLSFVTTAIVIKAVERDPFHKKVRALSSGPVPLALLRVDRYTLRVIGRGGLYAGPLGELFRGRADGLRAGSSVRLSDVHIVVVEDDGMGHPVVVDFRFSMPLEHSSLRWVRWNNGVYERMVLPSPGESVALEPAWGPVDFIRQPAAP